MSAVSYQQRLLEKLLIRARGLNLLTSRFSVARITIFIVGLMLLIGLWINAGKTVALWAGLVILIIFVIVARIHEKVELARDRLHIWRTIQERHLARMNHDWAGIPDPPDLASPSHPFAGDLDLTGPRSLLHLLDSTATVSGRRCLRKWMLEKPEFEKIPQRQAAVRSLTNHRRFRDRLTLMSLHAAGKDPRWDHGPIQAWFESPIRHSILDLKAKIVFGLSCLNLIVLGIGFAGGPMWWPYSVILYLSLYVLLLSRLSVRLEHIFKINRALRGLMDVLVWIENYESRLPAALHDVLRSLKGDTSPGLYKKRFHRIDTALAFSQGDISRFLLNSLFPYDLLLAIIFERMLEKLSPVVFQWIDMYGELEALNALATHADLNAAWCSFPELLPASDDACIKGESISHPLLSNDERVPNDLRLEKGRVAVITGSNMSGKSTYLRSAGIACVMAWAGGAVCARKLQISPMRIYTSMRIGDALQDGKSTFYAEVDRLSDVMKTVRDGEMPPVLVLLDEILRGTNTKERLIGAKSIVKELAGSNAISMIATHDQEVTKLDKERSEIVNYHFRERIEDGQLLFDYEMRNGPSDTTNALLIMKEAGLPVDAPE